jgi:hypothetical protein
MDCNERGWIAISSKYQKNWRVRRGNPTFFYEPVGGSNCPVHYSPTSNCFSGIFYSVFPPHKKNHYKLSLELKKKKKNCRWEWLRKGRGAGLFLRPPGGGVPAVPRHPDFLGPLPRVPHKSRFLRVCIKSVPKLKRSLKGSRSTIPLPSNGTAL